MLEVAIAAIHYDSLGMALRRDRAYAMLKLGEFVGFGNFSLRSGPARD